MPDPEAERPTLGQHPKLSRTLARESAAREEADAGPGPSGESASPTALGGALDAGLRREGVHSVPAADAAAAHERATPFSQLSFAGEEELSRQGRAHGLARLLLIALGSISSALAIAGAFLPILPTTPFLLLAASCFARSSPRLHRRLLANPSFGPYIEQWQHDHTVPRHAKRRAYALIVISFSLSTALVSGTPLRLGLPLVGLLLLALLSRVPVTPRGQEIERLR